MSAEKDLVAAMLARAVLDYQSLQRARAKDKFCQSWAESVERWILSTSKARFGFAWCCDIVGLDHEVFLARLLDAKVEPKEELLPSKVINGNLYLRIGKGYVNVGRAKPQIKFTNKRNRK